MQDTFIWFYIFIPNTFCENTKIKGSFDNWTDEKSISIKNLLGYHVFVIQLNSKYTNFEYKILDCNNKFITAKDRNVTDDIYQNCKIQIIENDNNDLKKNKNLNYNNLNETEDFDKYSNYEITDDFTNIVCKNSIFSIYIKNVLLYNGKLKNGLFTNYGKLYKSGELYYQGRFVNGKKTGYSTIYNKNQKIYTGYFKDDFKNGFGIEYYNNGVIKYEGDWVNNYYDGKGTYSYENGLTYYEGDWWKGKRFGMGTTFAENGTVIYKGIYINDIEKIFDTDRNVLHKNPLHKMI
jgi:hypothetical protein